LKPGLTGGSGRGCCAHNRRVQRGRLGDGRVCQGHGSEGICADRAYTADAATVLTGWATPLGADEPNGDLAQACQLKLAEAF